MERGDDRMKVVVLLEDGEKIIGKGREILIGREGIGGRQKIKKEEVDRARMFIDDLMMGKLKIKHLRNAYGEKDGHMPVMVVLDGKSTVEDGWYLRVWKVSDNFKESSYRWKHMVEHYYGGYMSNGAFIYASLLAKEKYGDGVKVKFPRDSKDAIITFTSPQMRNELEERLREYRRRR